MTPRAWKASLFAGLIAVVLVASFAFYRRGAFSQDYRWDLPPCFEAGEPYHHRFKPNCRESVRTPQGRVEFQTNEDGYIGLKISTPFISTQEQAWLKRAY